MTFRSRYSSVLSRIFCLVFAVVATTSPAHAQTSAGSISTSTIPVQTDLNLINIPTTRSLRRHQSYFRLTHRFARDLRRGDFGDLASDLFSLDNGAVIGVEYRFAITSRVHAGANRSMLSKTIQTFAKWDAVRQSDSLPVSVSLTGSFEGLNNLRQDYQPGAAVTVSRTFGDALAVYATPAFVWRTRMAASTAGPDNTALLGLGARVRFSTAGYIVGEYTPRLYGFDPDKGVWGAGIEKRTGGHTLQLNLTNAFGTTLGQIARGGSPRDIYLGFNITRQF